MLGLIQIIQIIIGIVCGIYFWEHAIGKMLLIFSILLTAGLIYQVGKYFGKEK